MRSGIQLLHVFENEWTEKKEIVKSIILTKLNIFDNIITEFTTMDISNDEYKIFYLNNDLNGYTPAKYKIGLFHNELIHVYSYQNQILLKNCSKLNTKIIGGFSIFLKNYKFKKLITNIDLRYYNKNEFEDWEIISQNPPNYNKIWDCGNLKLKYKGNL